VKLSQYFHLAEFEVSDTAARYGVDNSVPAFLLPKAKKLAKKADLVRKLLGVPMIVLSGYRCLRLNRLLHSKDTSQHLRMEAIDFIAPKYGTPLEICMLAVANKEIIQFDQLIQEHGWVHISFVDPDEIPARVPRLEVLTLLPDGKYRKGL